MKATATRGISLLLLLVVAAMTLMAVSGPAEATFPGNNGKIAFADFTWVDGEGFSWLVGDVYAVDPVSGEAVNLTNTPGGNRAMYVNESEGVDYSPDGEKIAFVRGWNYGATEVWVMDADGSNQVQLTNSEGFNTEPAWFPDGRRLAISSNRRGGKADIYILSLNDARNDVVGVRRLTTDSKPDRDPVVSPSGKRIAFSRPMPSSDEIFTLNTSTREGRDNRGVRLTDNRWYEWHLDWSPNGERFVFDRFRAATSGGFWDTGIYSMRADGNGSLTELRSSGWHPAFSPSGTQIAYQDGSNIWHMKSNGTHRVKVTDSYTHEDARSLTWQPLP